VLRLKDEGFNELPQAMRKSTFSISIDLIREPIFLLLVGAGLIYDLLGDLQDALMLLSFVFVIIGITVYQERKTENALQALKNQSSPRPLVIRGHARCRIPGREVVRGDFIRQGARAKERACIASTTSKHGRMRVIKQKKQGRCCDAK